MTQDLMKIFIRYQIPSDLISYADNEEKEDTKYQSIHFTCFLTSRFEKLQTVKSYIQAMYQMVEQKKQEEIQIAQENRSYGA